MLCRTTTRQRRQLAVRPPRRPLTSDAVDRLTAAVLRQFNFRGTNFRTSRDRLDIQ